MARERWKYVELQARLQAAQIEHMFEEQLPGAGWFYDLLLPTRRLAVEFDGPYHVGPKQLAEDARKHNHAMLQGWHVLRIDTNPSAVIPASVLNSVLGC